MNNADFYNSISTFYNDMINFDSSVNTKKKLFPNFIKENYKTAIDLGCGSGADSIALASLGLQVTAYDNSTKMLEVARNNSTRYDCKIKISHSDIFKVAHPVKSCDLIISMGNTLANIPLNIINKIFKNVYRSLRVGGSFLFQILNYDRILFGEERIVGTTENENSIYVRFYDFEKNKLGFNILSIPKNELKNTQLFTTIIYPHSKEAIVKSLDAAGFSEIRVYGSLLKEKYTKRDSKDLIVQTIK